MIWKIVKHRDLSKEECLRIASLKDQHWQHGVESQIQWMKDNIEMDDIHLMGEELEAGIISLKAYMALINLTVQIDDQFVDCFGVGNVCVNKDSQHMGLGRTLLKEAEQYIKSHHKLGILLCKDALIPFYENNGWELDSISIILCCSIEIVRA